MQIKFHGAAGGEVTGSAYLVQTKNARVLVDGGMSQGGRAAAAKNRPPETARRGKLDAVVLTHAHLDHTGRLPLLAKLGYTGPVYATPATNQLTARILRDSARLQLQDAERDNRKRERAGEPLYTPEHAEAIIPRLKEVPYQKPVTVAPGIRACWAEAGHMLGSASIQLLVEEDGRTKNVVFSGDLGSKGAPILRDYEPFQQADKVVMESPYGDHDHRPFRETVEEFVGIVKHAVENDGKVLVPTFAVGRAQLLTLLMSWMFRKGKVKPFPVFLDSPMAIEATRIYTRHVELFDDDMRACMREGLVRDDLKTMKATESADDSKAVNGVKGPCLIMAGAGMCNAGRILHHLRQNLWKPETHVIIVGYQARGSLGRLLVEGEQFVGIHGEKIAVRAQIHTLGGFSAHAGQTDLLSWFSAIAPSKPRVIVAHGEDGPRKTLAKLIQQRHGLKPTMPAIGDVIEL
ncbi:MAG: MBL fold metallo-hydrolase [Phycisphaerae bacterium]|nr:MBL fold metallo-hydrolase [Phycisphaerae bacterium]